MKILIIIFLSLFAIAGFYVNRDFWFGWIAKPHHTKTEIQEGVVVGYQEVKNLPSGKDNISIGDSIAPDIIWGHPLSIGRVWLDVNFMCTCGQHIIMNGTVSTGDTINIPCKNCGEIYYYHR